MAITKKKKSQLLNLAQVTTYSITHKIGIYLYAFYVVLSNNSSNFNYFLLKRREGCQLNIIA